MKFAAIRLSALGALTALTMGAANAAITNFMSMADGAFGESAYKPLILNPGDGSNTPVKVTINGFVNNTQAFAYLDSTSGTPAGLGVCGKIFSTASEGKSPNNKSNICDPSSDDNVTVKEALSFVFAEDVFVKFWFNNNHDNPAGFVPGDVVNIAGKNYDVADGVFYNNNSPTNGAFISGNAVGLFAVPAGFDLRVAFSNQQFYVSGMEVFKEGGGPPAGEPPVIQVPEPASLALTGLALLGVAATRRRRA